MNVQLVPFGISGVVADRTNVVVVAVVGGACASSAVALASPACFVKFDLFCWRCRASRATSCTPGTSPQPGRLLVQREAPAANRWAGISPASASILTHAPPHPSGSG